MKKLLGIVVLGLLWCNVGLANELIKIPVHVNIIDLSEKGLPTKIKERDIKEDFKKVNKIWSQANIFWEIKAINTTKGNIKSYDKDRKFLIKNFLKHAIKGTKAQRTKYYSKLNAYLLNFSGAKNFKLHTKKLNIYYVPQILPKQASGASTFEMPGYNIRPNSAFMNTTKWDKRYFTGVVKGTFRSGLTFIQEHSKINPDRANTLAHELGHQFLLLHDGKKIGKNLMAVKCVNNLDTGTKLCGEFLSKAEISKSRKFYNKYYKRTLQ